MAADADRDDLYDRDALVRELIRDEGLRLKPYRDSLGYWTVGVGHLLTGNELAQFVDPATGIVRRKLTEERALALLHVDIARAEVNLSRIYPRWNDLDPVRQRALLNLSFNLGARLCQFRGFLGQIDRRDWPAAGRHLMQALWWKQVKSRGPRIRHMIETGTPWESADAG